MCPPERTNHGSPRVASTLMNKLFSFIWMLAGLLVPAVVSSSPIGPITNLAVSETGIGPTEEACAAFTVTPNQARAFLDRAVIVSGRQQHDFFLHGSCAARGTLETRYGTWRWEIRNMGTGSIEADSGEIFFLGDPALMSPLSIQFDERH